MLDANMASELFLDLSEEQQQIVTGGSYVGDEIRDKLATYYKADASITMLNVVQQSGPNGSMNMQQFKHDTASLDTGAYKALFARLS
jgi:hypothetical protein